MNNAILYARVSSAEQANEGISLDAQTERLEAYCKLSNLSPIATYREEGVSAFKPLSKRPKGNELLTLIRQGKAEHIVALKLDRLFRNTPDALKHTEQWDKSGISLHIVDLGGQTLNTGSAMGRFFITIMAGIAELERNLTGERTKSSLDHLKKNGKAYTRITPYGFDNIAGELVANEQELNVIRQMNEFRTRGFSYAYIAQVLNKNEIPTKQNKKWHPQTVRDILIARVG